MSLRFGHTAVFVVPPVLFLTIAALVGCFVIAEARHAAAGKATPAHQAARSANPSQEKKLELDAKNFINPAAIDNKWMPLTPGMRFTYDGKTVEDDGSTVPHRI